MSNPVKHTMIVENLSAGYHSKDDYLQVINDISFELIPGKLNCLMGPNGAGKSTLLRCISGLQQFNKGRILIEGVKLNNIPTSTLSKKIAVVLTEPVLASHMTVKELIAMGRYPHMGWFLTYRAADEELIQKTAIACGIDHLMDKNIHSLSDGQRQKVLIARALAQESQILILDEPTSHLDLNNRVEILGLLKQICRKENKTIIMATHELDLALQMADRLLLLNKDGILSRGIPEDLVLNGKLDEVFSFKGYDLKTGKVQHHQKGGEVDLQGEGHVYLWTKNALEREGFTITKSAERIIKISGDNGTLHWNTEGCSFQSIQALLDHLMIKKGR